MVGTLERLVVSRPDISLDRPFHISAILPDNFLFLLNMSGWVYNSTIMKNAQKIVITLLIVSLLSLPPIICCCAEEALADSPQHAEHCHDQSVNAGPEHQSHSSQECMCPQMAGDLFSNTFDIRLVSSHFYKGFLNNGLAFVIFSQDSLLSYTSLLADRPPPSLTEDSIPIYLKTSALRI